MPSHSFHRAALATLGVALACLAIPPVAFAQGAQGPNLATATEISCSFSVVATGTWTREGDALADARKADLTIVYQAVDAREGSAEVKGSVGNLYITARYVGGYLHLLAISSDGPIYITTIFSRESHKGKFKAAHSRHEFTDVSLPGYTSRPEQYTGECELVK